MSEPGFKVERIHRGTPFRPRTVFHSYLVFSDPDGAVLIEARIAEQLRAAASRARPNETGGLLAGRAFHDADGSYVAVCGYVEANEGSGRLANFQMSPQATERLSGESARIHKMADVVGWWHSHLGPSNFSPTDLGTQEMWTNPESVGLLVFADGQPWGAAHLGPTARRLTYSIPAPNPTPNGRTESTHPIGQSKGIRMKSMPQEGSYLLGHSGSWRTQRLWNLISLIAIIVIGLGVMIGLMTGLQSISGQLRQLNSMLAESGELPSISWSCAERSPLTYRCIATVSRISGSLRWQLDGKDIATGLRTSITLPDDSQRHRISVLLENSSGVRDGGSVLVYAPVQAPAPHRSSSTSRLSLTPH